MSLEFALESEVVYRALIDAAPDGIVIVNQEGRIVLVNAQTERLFGYQRSELLNQPVEILVPERARGKHRFHRAGFMSSRVLRPMGAGPSRRPHATQASDYESCDQRSRLHAIWGEPES